MHVPEEPQTDPGLIAVEEGPETKDHAAAFFGISDDTFSPSSPGAMMPEVVSQLEEVLGTPSVRPDPNRSRPDAALPMRLAVIQGDSIDRSPRGQGLHSRRKDEVVDARLEVPTVLASNLFSHRSSRRSVPPAEPSEEMPLPPPVPWRNQDVSITPIRPVEKPAPPPLEPLVAPPPPARLDQPQIPEVSATTTPVVKEAAPSNGVSLGAVIAIALLGLALGAGGYFLQPKFLPNTSGVAQGLPIDPASALPIPGAPVGTPVGQPVGQPTEVPSAAVAPPTRNDPPLPQTGVLQIWSDQTARITVDGISKGTVQGQGGDAGPQSGRSNLAPIPLSPGTHVVRATSSSGRSRTINVRIDEGRPNDLVIHFSR